MVNENKFLKYEVIKGGRLSKVKITWLDWKNRLNYCVYKYIIYGYNVNIELVKPLFLCSNVRDDTFKEPTKPLFYAQMGRTTISTKFYA